VRAAGVHKARRGGAEHELDHLSALSAHLKTATLFVHGEDDTQLEATAEVGDARLSSDAR
jgi:hypothetical protein